MSRRTKCSYPAPLAIVSSSVQQEPDRIFNFLCRVFFKRCRDLFLIFLFFGVLVLRCYDPPSLSMECWVLLDPSRVKIICYLKACILYDIFSNIFIATIITFIATKLDALQLYN